MDRAAQEFNMQLMDQMMTTCKEKTIATKHSSNTLSASETTQFKNCLMKFFETPNHVMSALNQMGGM